MTLRSRPIRQPRTDLDGRNLATDQPLVPLARRRTGVKNGCGTGRDVVSFLVRLRPRISLTPGTGLSRGRSLSLRLRHVAQLLYRPCSGQGLEEVSVDLMALPGSEK
jgi:hypothetical protein